MSEVLRPTGHQTIGTVDDPGQGYDANLETKARVRAVGAGDRSQLSLGGIPNGTIAPASRSRVILQVDATWAGISGAEATGAAIKLQRGSDPEVLLATYGFNQGLQVGRQFDVTDIVGSTPLSEWAVRMVCAQGVEDLGTPVYAED
jgi:hypothetical protein